MYQTMENQAEGGEEAHTQRPEEEEDEEEHDHTQQAGEEHEGSSAPGHFAFYRMQTGAINARGVDGEARSSTVRNDARLPDLDAQVAGPARPGATGACRRIHTLGGNMRVGASDSSAELHCGHSSNASLGTPMQLLGHASTKEVSDCIKNDTATQSNSCTYRAALQSDLGSKCIERRTEIVVGHQLPVGSENRRCDSLAAPTCIPHPRRVGSPGLVGSNFFRGKNNATSATIFTPPPCPIGMRPGISELPQRGSPRAPFSNPAKGKLRENQERPESVPHGLLTVVDQERGPSAYGSERNVSRESSQLFSTLHDGYAAEVLGLGQGAPVGRAGGSQTKFVSHVVRMNQWPRNPRPPSTAWHMPLYIPAVARARTEQIVGESEDPRLLELWTSLHSIPLPLVEEAQPSVLSPEDIQRLCENTTLVSIADNSEPVTAIAFSVDETSKQRRRFILWPKMLNDVLGRTSQFSLPSVEQVIQIAAASLRNVPHGATPAVVTADLRAAFFQHEVPEALQRWFVFKVGKGRQTKKLKLLVLAMGFVSSPEIQQRLSKALTRKIPPALGLPQVREIIFLDNFAFFGTNHQVAGAAKILQALTSRYAVTIGEGPDITNDSFIFLGLQFSLKSKTVAVAQKTIDRLRNITIQKSMHWRIYCQLMGLLFFCSSVLLTERCHYYYAFKCYRNFCQMPKLHARLSSAAFDQLCQWRESSLLNTPRSLEPRVMNHNWHLYTDASDSGFGYVLFADEVYSDMGTWTPEFSTRPIAVRELYAVLFAARAVQGKRLSCSSVHLHVDNTAVLFALQKGYSPVYELNSLIAQIPHFGSIAYVQTERNPADPLSRGVPLEQVGKPEDTTSNECEERETATSPSDGSSLDWMGCTA